MAITPGTKRSLWLAGMVAVLAVAGCTSAAPSQGKATASTTAVHVSGAAVPASASSGRFPATFIAISTGKTGSRLAVFSAASGRLLKYLTAAEAGGGPGEPSLTAGGLVIFERLHGTCSATIDTVPARGGPERVLIGTVGQGNQAVLPDQPSGSADGRYLSYITAHCFPPPDQSVHLRNLHTGRELSRPGWVGADSVSSTMTTRLSPSASPSAKACSASCACPR